MTVNKCQIVYEGKTKIIYKTDREDLYIQYFKDDIVAFNGAKRGIVPNKGIYTNKISARLFMLLNEEGIPTHYVSSLNEREMLVKPLKMLKMEVVIRNIAAGSFSARFGIPEGTELPFPILEYYYKDDNLGDPLLNFDHIAFFKLATKKQLEKIKKMAFKVNEILTNFFSLRNLILVDFKLEFGEQNGQLFLGDEISPDVSRLWDKNTKEKLDIDRFRDDLGKIEESYREVLNRVLSV